MTRRPVFRTHRRWLLLGAALAAAAGVGFGAAQLMAPRTPAAPPVTDKAAPPVGADNLPMSPQRLALSGVGVQTVAVGGLNAEVLSQATVVAEPGGEAVLTARAAGSVARIDKRLGDPVRAGEVLALVQSREAAQIAAARSMAQAKAVLARKIYARERSLYEQKVSPRQDMETAEAELAAAEAEARGAVAAVAAAEVSRDGRHVMVASPISGRVTAASASLGAFVQPETELFRIADPSRIQVEAPVTATDALRVQPGDAAVIETSAGDTLSAVVRSVTPGLNPDTRSATVVLTLVEGRGLQPGQLVRARIATRRNAGGAIVVPEEAVQTVEGHDAVFVRTAKGFRAQPVTVGRRSAGRAEIVSGLKPGEQIAVKNAFLLKAELGKGSEDED